MNRWIDRESQSTRISAVRIWDLPTRLFHWLLAGLVVLSIVSGKIGGTVLEWHMISGYCILSLLLFRVIWGFFGSDSARFRLFLKGPAATSGYLSRMLRGKAEFVAGHNPAGGWMVLVMIAVLLFQAVSGLFANDEIFNEGPLYHWVTNATSNTLTGWHKTNSNIILALIALHLAALVWHRLAMGEKLTSAMISGFKTINPGVQKPDDMHFVGIAPAAILISATSVAVWLLLFLG